MPTMIASETASRAIYFLMTSLVVPRPIAWISTVGKGGGMNLAPYSHFTNCSSDPPIVLFSSNGVKHTLRNIRDTGEFVVNLVTHDVRHRMRITAASWPTETDEIQEAGLSTMESDFVKAPRVREAKASMECKLHDIIRMGDGHVVFGDVVCFHVDDAVMLDGRVVAERLQPVGKLDASNYATVHEVERLELPPDKAMKVADFGKADR